MIELTGQVRVRRLTGTINIIPSESGGGGPLQAKTVYPSHSEQVIAPDEDYYGLVSVTVKPVPRLPACMTSLVEDGELGDIAGEVVNISTNSKAEERTAETYSYNGVELPEIPSEFEGYPYRIIVYRETTGAYTPVLSSVPWYFNGSTYIYTTGSVSGLVMECAEEVPYMLCVGTNYRFSMSAYTVVWSSHDIPDGSPDAEEIYFSGTDPVKV